MLILAKEHRVNIPVHVAAFLLSGRDGAHAAHELRDHRVDGGAAS